MEGARALREATLPGPQQRGSRRKQGSTCNRRKALVTTILLATSRLCLGINCEGLSESSPLEVYVGKDTATLVLEEGCDQVADSSLVVFLTEHLEPTETINISGKIGNVTGNCSTRDPAHEADLVVLALLKQEAGRCAVLCSAAATPCISIQNVKDRAQALVLENLVMARAGPPGGSDIVLIQATDLDIPPGVVAAETTVLIGNSTFLAQGGAEGSRVQALNFPAESVSGLYVHGATFANLVEPGTGAVLGVPAVFSGVIFTGTAGGPTNPPSGPSPDPPLSEGPGIGLQPPSPSSPTDQPVQGGSVACDNDVCKGRKLQQNNVDGPGGPGILPDVLTAPTEGVLEALAGASVLLRGVEYIGSQDLALVHLTAPMEEGHLVFAAGPLASEYLVTDGTQWVPVSTDPLPPELQDLDAIGTGLWPQAADAPDASNSPPVNNTPPTRASTSAAASPDTASDGGSFGTPAIAGVVAAVVIALVAIAAGTLFLLVRHRRRKQAGVRRGLSKSQGLPLSELAPDNTRAPASTHASGAVPSVASEEIDTRTAPFQSAVGVHAGMPAEASPKLPPKPTTVPPASEQEDVLPPGATPVVLPEGPRTPPVPKPHVVPDGAASSSTRSDTVRAAALTVSSGITSLHLTHLNATRPGPGAAGGAGAAAHSGTPSQADVAGVSGRKEALDNVLDALRDRDEPLFGRYQVLSSLERRSGGQGCVQFVFDPEARREFAVKFFFRHDAFAREAALYAEPELRAMMAATRSVCDNADGAARTRGGYAFPPHIVIERGEPLDEWKTRMARRGGGELSMIAIVQALTNIAERLLLLHEAGYVHRDLKPSNVLWLSNMHGWTLIDFGSTVRIGEAAPLSFTLAYAAPEVVAAYEASARTAVAAAAADVWALGAIAFEMLAGEPLFPPLTPPAAVLDAIAGRSAMPWEGPRAPELLRRLRVFKRHVLECLQRDPARRPSVGVVVRAWDHLFHASTTASTQVRADDSSRAPGGVLGAGGAPARAVWVPQAGKGER